MATIEVRNLPSETRRIFLRRASEAGQSLEEYVRSRLIADAAQPTLDEVLDRIDHRSGGRAPLDVTSARVRNDRDRR